MGTVCAMNSGHMDLINKPRADHRDAAPVDVARVDTAMEELIRRARLQAGELSLMIQRLERLRRDITVHLQSGTDGPIPHA